VSLLSLLLLVASRPLLPRARRIPVVSCRVVSCRVVSCRVVSCLVSCLVSCCVVLCHVVLLLTPTPTSKARSVAVVHPLTLPSFVDCCVLLIWAAALVHQSSSPSRPAYSVASHHCPSRHRRSLTCCTSRSILPLIPRCRRTRQR
jgi:hypothetical protein